MVVLHRSLRVRIVQNPVPAELDYFGAARVTPDCSKTKTQLDLLAKLLPSVVMTGDCIGYYCMGKRSWCPEGFSVSDEPP